MPRATVRRPLPALAFLLVLSVLTALVWWRVINRASEDNKASAQPSCPTSTAVAAVPQPAAVTVSVLNSTARNGLARTTSETLKKDGFDIGVVDNDTPGLTIAGVAQVRYGPSGKAAATLLSFSSLARQWCRCPAPMRRSSCPWGRSSRPWPRLRPSSTR